MTIKECLFLWLPSIPVSLSSPQMHLQGRTIKQCLFLIMVPHRSPTDTSRQEQAPTTDRSCLGTPFDSSVLTPPQMHLRRQTIFRDFPNVSLHFSMVLLDFSMVLLDSSMVLFNFLLFYSIFPSFCSIFLGFCLIFPWCLLHFPIVLLHFSMVYPIFRWF